MGKEEKTLDKPLGNKAHFMETVFEIVKLIPCGRVTTYGAIAKCIGMASSARLVGWTLKHSHQPSDNIPAHRVVNRNGQLSGKHHFNPPTLMQQLLESESITIKDDTITNFQQIFWDPASLIKDGF